METQITITEAERNFSDLISRVIDRGETVVLTRNGDIVGRIVPEPLKKARTGKEFAEMWENLPHLSPEEAEAWGEDIEAGRREWNRPPKDPWEKWG